MKRFGALLLSLAIIASLTACGPFQSDMLESEEQTTTEETTSAEGTEATTMVELPDRYSGRQTCYKTIANDEKPELVKVSFSGECDGNIKAHASVGDLYGIDVLHSGVVGLVGSPIELTYDNVREPEIGFIYDREQLRGVPEKNLIMLHYNENDQFYDTVENAKLDTEKCTVSARVKEEGVYLLADAYQWYSCWGMDVSKYVYDSDPTAYKTDWERELDTGSIMELADKQWAVDNAPDFHVSTPEELASVVYYVNGVNKDGQQVNITLEDDIDLTGYDWKPIGWTNAGTHQFSGTVDGRNHNINGMKINVDYEDCGFIGYGLDVVMKDISFTNADVSGTAEMPCLASITSNASTTPSQLTSPLMTFSCGTANASRFADSLLPPFVPRTTVSPPLTSSLKSSSSTSLEVVTETPPFFHAFSQSSLPFTRLSTAT